MIVQTPSRFSRFTLTKSLQRLLFYIVIFILFILTLTLYVLQHNPSTHLHPSIRLKTRSLDIEYDSEEPSYITGVQIVTCRTFWRCVPPKPNNVTDANNGQWLLINKPLSFSKSLLKPSSIFTQKYLFIEKTPLSFLTYGKDKIVTDLNIYSHRMVTYDLETYNKDDVQRYYYDIDVLFGVDSVEVRPGWVKLDKPYYPEVVDQTEEMPVYLSVKKLQIDNQAVQLQRTDETRYKILQVADLHYATGPGTCRDQFPFVKNCQADPRTKVFLERVLDHENPDLIALTGDQIFGEDSFDTQTTIMKVVEPFIKRGIPYIFTFGNHDDEGSLTRLEIFQFLQTLPYFHGPKQGLIKGVHGVGNMITQVFDIKDTYRIDPLLTINLLDSHKYTPNQKVYPGYDWVKESQLIYLEDQYKTLPKPSSSQKHISLAFLHIPLPEYRHIYTQSLPVSGSYKEGITAPYFNSGTKDALRSLDVSLVSVGHDHCNDFCITEEDGMRLCYGGAVGEGGYAGYGGTERRLRVWDFSWNNSKIKGETWKWLETDVEMKNRLDYEIVVN